MPSDCTTAHRSSGTLSDGTTSDTSAEAVYPEFPEAARRRVAKVDVNQGRCAITAGRERLDYAHVLARNIESEILDRFEYNMGMEWRTLNVDSRYNVILLESSLREALLSVQWALLPDLEIVLDLERILDVKDRTERRALFDAFLKKRTTYNYTLLPAKTMETFRIPKRANSPISDSSVNQASPPEYYEYPFTDLPVIVSHLQPHFAIIDAGMKIHDPRVPFYYSPTITLLTREKGSQAFHIPHLARLWREDIPEDAKASFFRTKPRSEFVDGDSSSVATAPHRLEPIPFIGPLPNSPAFPFLSSKRPHEDDDILPLHRKSLRKLERASRESRETRDKSMLVSEWAEGVTNDPPSTDDV